MAVKTNIVPEIIITGTSDADSIFNYAYKVTINSGNGDDYVENNYDEHFGLENSSVSINTGEGNDSVYGWHGWEGQYCTINTGTGNDYVFFDNPDSIIKTGAGNDTVCNGNGWFDTINTGEGNDLISLQSMFFGDTVNKSFANVIVYTKGDGNDIIYGFDGDDRLSIVGGSYSTAKSGDDVIVTVGKGKITLKGASALDYVNIIGEETPIETNKWTLDGTTAKYGTSNKTLVTVKGVKSLSGLSLSNKVVTVSNASLNQGTVTISGDGYTLKLGSNVTKSTSTAAKWSLNGSTATYKSGKTTAGYKLASNKISYVTESGGKTLATVSGVKSTSGLSVSNKVVTVSNASLNKKAVTITNGYTLKLGSNVTKSTSTAAKWSLSGSTATYKSGATTAGYKLSDNKISYVPAKSASTLFKISGVKKLSDITTSGNITSGTAKVTTSGNNVIFTIGTAKITVKGAADKTLTYYDASGKKTYSPAIDDEPYTVKGKGVTLSSGYSAKKFNVSTINGGNSIVTIDASAVTHEIEVKGNSKANKIIGGGAGGTIDGGAGKVNDTLIGGNGADIFVYYKGDGNDVIQNYSANDTIKIAEGTVSSISTSRENVIFKVGSGKITIQDAKETRITYVEDGIEYGCLNGKKTFTISKKNDNTVATLAKNYWKDSFDVTSFGNEEVGSSISRIDASKVTHGLIITGNDKANEILASEGNNTIIGGKGNDTIYGGDGSNVYVYKQGDGDDRIYNYGDSDKVSITTSGTVKVTAKGNDVVFTVGKGKITLEDAVDKTITYVENGKTKSFAAPDANNDMWFMNDEDNFIGTDNQLSSIVRDGATSYSALQMNSPLTLTTKRLEQELTFTPTPLKR